MAYTIGKRMTAYPPIPRPDAGAHPRFTAAGGGNLNKAGSVLTAELNSPWIGRGTQVPSYQWILGGAIAYASATNASYSVSANNSATYLTCRVGMGNATWGTGVYDILLGTCRP